MLQLEVEYLILYSYFSSPFISFMYCGPHKHIYVYISPMYKIACFLKIIK